ncbi:hypothetical protein GCM10007359_20620 [Rothia aerolata]|uniref:Uncharacterized protein n=1 Tax=Rothia aerolata TaxID=1812262 RepID=A0A917IW81_9MICC|nr:hypothetical protein GCM10007359_20620 [Rothia aerolata]
MPHWGWAKVESTAFMVNLSADEPGRFSALVYKPSASGFIPESAGLQGEI